MAETENGAQGKYDAIVVGGGPSGCSCALFLARAGRKVLLLEKASFPREKVCGDAFSGKSINIARELGLLGKLGECRHGIVRRLAMTAPNGKKVTVPFKNADGMEFAGYVIERKDTDSVFFNAAKAEPNVTAMENFSVYSVTKDAAGAVDGVEGTAAGSTEKKRFKSRVVVGADGAASAVSRSLGLPSQPTGHVFSAVRCYYEGVSGLGEEIELYFIDSVLPGYLWVFPMGGTRANVGVGILSSDLAARKKHPNAIMAEAIKSHPALAERFKAAHIEGRIGGWAIPNGSYVKKCFGSGWVLVGDSASLVDPFSGEGVGNALMSGKLAAQAIGNALSQQRGGGPLPAESLEAYSKSIDAAIRPEIVDSYRLQRLTRIRFLLNLFIGKAADKPEMRQVFVDMMRSDDAKKSVRSPLFYLKLLLS